MNVKTSDGAIISDNVTNQHLLRGLICNNQPYEWLQGGALISSVASSLVADVAQCIGCGEMCVTDDLVAGLCEDCHLELD